MLKVLQDLLPLIETKKKQKELKNWNSLSTYFNKMEATLRVLGLDLIFTWKTIPPYINEENHVVIRHWKNCWNNPVIKKFMQQQFELEKQKSQNLQTYENYFKSLFCQIA